MISREARSILDKALEMGEGDPVLASLRSIQAGVLDIPWAPNQFVAGKVIPVRDDSGAVRYLDPPTFPLAGRSWSTIGKKSKKGSTGMGKKIDYQAAIFDITEVSKMLGRVKAGTRHESEASAGTKRINEVQSISSEIVAEV